MKEHERPWYDSYDAQVPHSIEYEELALYEYLDRSAAAHPKRDALIFRNYKLSYQKLQQLAEIFAANLKKHGVQPGDRVSIMLPNLPQTIIAFWGVLKAGGVVVMTNPLYMETELLHHINDSGAKVMIALDILWPKLSSLRSRLGIETFFFHQCRRWSAFSTQAALPSSGSQRKASGIAAIRQRNGFSLANTASRQATPFPAS